MKRLIAGISTATFTLMALSGCMKLDFDAEVKSDNTVSGSMVYAMSDDLTEMMEQFGGSEDMDSDDPFSEIPVEKQDSVEVEEYKKDGYTGRKATFKDWTLEEFNEWMADDPDSESPTNFSIERDGDKFVFSGSAEKVDPEELKQMEMMMGGLGDNKPEFSFSVAFPGKVVEHEGPVKVDGNKVTLDEEFFMNVGGDFKIVAEAEGNGILGGDSDSDGNNVLIIGLVGVGVVILAGGLLFLLRARSEKTVADQPQDYNYTA